MLIFNKLTKITLHFAAAAAMAITAYSAYKGHANDADVNAILTTYPELKGTATDGCVTCHKSGEVREAGKTRSENHCGYCHAVHVRGKGDVKQTLNSYGAEYLAAGRGPKAVKSLAIKDSDGDGFSNEAEFKAGTDPGRAHSNPSAPIAPFRIYSSGELKNMSSAVNGTVFLNTSHNKAGDFYNQYRGNTVYELLKAVGISGDATSVDFISYDGFEGTFTLDELKQSWPQAPPVMGLSKKDIGPCGWVNYNAPGLDAKTPLPNLSILLAFEENGKAIEKARFNPETGKINGTGPLRLVVPQFQTSPPDLPQFADKACQEEAAPEHRFNGDYDHNGGRSSFAILAIRVNPLPKGTRDLEWEKVRDRFVAEEKLAIFGALKSPTRE
jgi:hypothetical protein